MKNLYCLDILRNKPLHFDQSLQVSESGNCFISNGAVPVALFLILVRMALVRSGRRKMVPW